MRDLALVAFDLDGTLVDSRTDIATAANILLVECGAQPLPEAAVVRMVGEGAATLVARLFEAAAIQPPPDALPRFLQIYDRYLVVHTRPYPGIPDVLDELHRRYPLALLTNKPTAVTRRLMGELGLARFFDPGFVIGGDGPYPRKPDPTGLLMLARAADTTAERTCLVGDSVIDWRTARAAGAMGCVARYGFGFQGFPEADLAAVDMLAETPAQLLALL
ncbi:MAG: HAD family hydrolase [Vicinamibacterales bacterium]